MAHARMFLTAAISRLGRAAKKSAIVLTENETANSSESGSGFIMRLRSFVLGSSLVAFSLAQACSSGELTSSNICAEGQRVVDGQCLTGNPVRLNSVGYLPERAKFTTFGGATPDFTVHDASNDEVVLEGKAEGPLENDDTEEMVFVGDFSELTDPGSYYVKTSAGRSATFTVGGDALDEALQVTMLGLYGQRCGTEVEFEHGEHTFRHQECHMAKANISEVVAGAEPRDDTGGWHDAGDYGKYVRNGAFAVALLLKAHEDFPEVSKNTDLQIPEKGGDTPDLLDESRVELEWLLKVQFDDGSFSHKVTAKGFEGNVLPEVDTQERFFVSTSSHSTANAVAALALAARLFDPYDAKFAETCLAAAIKGQSFLTDHPEEIEPNQSEFETGGYGSKGDQDERLWALAELWETTGESDYLYVLEEFVSGASMRDSFDWANTENLGLVTYVRSAREGRDPALVEKVIYDVMTSADYLVSQSRGHGYGRAVNGYYWGSNGSVARTAYNLVAAHKLFPNTAYLDAISAQIDHLFGRNVFSRSFVTGLGTDPPQSPHHRPSAADSIGVSWPGLLVGGPHGTERWGHKPGDPMVLDALNWSDIYANYLHNEIAINWNTALAYALIAAKGTQGDESVACHPGCVSAPDVSVGGAGGGGFGGQGGATP